MINFKIGANYCLQINNPVDYIYSALNIRMLNLDKNHHEYKLIEKYISNTHKIKEGFLKNIFAIERKGEPERYNKWKNLSNRMLLWHGSTTINIMGILALGLRIAPSKTAVAMNGSSYGKGVYFADAFEKSFSYCNNRWSTDENQEENSYFMLLCEVSLGKMYKVNEFQNITELNGIIANNIVFIFIIDYIDYNI